MPESHASGISLRWDNGKEWALLEVDFAVGTYAISHSGGKK
jgi:hypothetical protein